MVDRQSSLTIYAAGASLAAIALVYVFAPTFFIDRTSTGETSSSQPAGLLNPANDCFINCILQATAGLPELREYLKRELQVRRGYGHGLTRGDVTRGDVDKQARGGSSQAWRLEGLRRGDVTRAFKDILDKLDEESVSRQTVSAAGFIGALELSFGTKISRRQQDAQEFLQLVLERLHDEFGARRKTVGHETPDSPALDREPSEVTGVAMLDKSLENEKFREKVELREFYGLNEAQQVCGSIRTAPPAFPFEGKTESIIRCTTCNFSPKSMHTSFVTLTLNVPETPATTLNACFDGLLKLENIEDYVCDRCRLYHALDSKQRELDRVKTSNDRGRLARDIEQIRIAILENPETPPEGLDLPDRATAPKRHVERHTRIAHFPQILAIHLSRSLFSVGFSDKNEARVSFPEILPLGGLLQQRKYRLLAIVAHRGGHHSGHYETFRRKGQVEPPYHRNFKSGVPTANNATAAAGAKGWTSDQHHARRFPTTQSSQGVVSTTDDTVWDPRAAHSIPSHADLGSSAEARHGKESESASTNSNVRSTEPGMTASSVRTSAPSPTETPQADPAGRKIRPKKHESKWWRISDARVKESTRKEVLGMQKEVYLLFYELLEEDD